VTFKSFSGTGSQFQTEPKPTSLWEPYRN